MLERRHESLTALKAANKLMCEWKAPCNKLPAAKGIAMLKVMWEQTYEEQYTPYPLTVSASVPCAVDCQHADIASDMEDD